jgi:integrase
MRTPSYRLHKPSGQAVVTLDGHDVYLGKHDTPQSRAEYDRLIAEWLSNGRRLSPSPAGPAGCSDLSVNELILAYWKHAEEHYRLPTGEPTDEQHCIRSALRPLRELYGHTAAREFGPLALKAVRLKMVQTVGPTGRLWSRNFVNASIRRLKAVFKWAVQNELVPAAVYQGLLTVGGLQKGRTPARETEPVKPVAPAHVEAVLPLVLPPVRAMIQLQRLTGMRPGEACALRACDIDMTGPVWLYRPGQHKTAWRGRERVVALGPRAQEAIRPFLTLNTQAYLFSPSEAVRALRERQRQGRKSKVQPSQVCRKSRRPKKAPGERYTSRSYKVAVLRGCRAADRKAREDARREALAAGRPPPDEGAVFVPAWNPNQLRHLHGTEVRRRFGLEAAQVALGHAKADVTQVYAERNLTLAVQVAQQIG